MQAYCPRCNQSSDLPEAALVQGECPTCGGQLSAGGGASAASFGGAVAMTFNVGSNVAVPFVATYEQQQLDMGDRRDTQRLSAPPAGLFAGSDLPSASAPPDYEAGDEDGKAAASPPPPPVHLALGEASVDAGEDEGEDICIDEPPPAGLGDGETAAGEQQDVGPAAAEQDAAVGDDPGSGEQPAGDAARAGLHLQLPSIDFSMPDLGCVPPPSTAGGATSTALPAHLQLPSFPEFALPPIPGAGAPADTAPGVIQPAAAPPQAGAQAGEAPVPAAPMQQPGQGAAAPPPRPPPPPLRARPKKAPPPTAAGGLDDLPSIGLPAVAAPKTREPTLLGSDAAAELAELSGKRSALPVVLLVFVLLAAAGVGGTFVYFGPATVIGWFSPQEAPAVVKTKRQQADELVLEAKKAYGATQYTKSIGLLEDAVALEPAHSEAHRTLGIAFAKTHKQDAAVEHYRKYLELSPDAEDATTVRKFIDDYDKARGKDKDADKASEPEPSSQAPDKKPDKKRPRRR